MARRVSDVTSEVLATGEATMSQLAQMFETDPKTLPQRMKGVIPAGRRNGYKVYNIREAAGRLVKPGYEIEAFIRQMSPQELPPLLQKEFWNGQRARTAYEKEIGNLWPTEDVVAMAAVLQQGIRQTMLLVVDDLDREEGLTTRQRKTFRRICDDALTKFRTELAEKFKEYHADRAADRAKDEPLGRVDSDGLGVSGAPEDEEDYI